MFVDAWIKNAKVWSNGYKNIQEAMILTMILDFLKTNEERQEVQ